MVTVRSNIPAQHILGQRRENLQTLGSAIERLASGLRINSAKDDAAGMSVANRMSSQISGLKQSIKNANDGVSLSQTTQGALGQVNERLQRIRELAVQGLSQVYDGDTGDKIQAEINMNLKEIDRLNQQSSFNGIPLLNGAAGVKNLQVGANDGETLSVDLSPPGFSVEELGLVDLTLQGAPDTLSPVATLSGFSSLIPIDDPVYTTVNYSPPDNSPNLVRGQLYGSSRLVQYGGDGGQLKNGSTSASHDTDTRLNNVSIYGTGTLVTTTLQEYISTRTYQDPAGDPLVLTNPGVVRSGGKYWIEERISNSERYYYEADLTILGNKHTVQAKAKTTTPVALADMTSGVSSPLTYAPGVSKSSATYSLMFDGVDESANSALSLVQLGSYYYIEENLGAGQFAYYQAGDVTIKTDGATHSIDVAAARDPAKKLVLQDVPTVSGTSTAHLKPSNANVQVNYTEFSENGGRFFSDVMSSDGDGGYIFNIYESVDGSGAYKTAKVVRNQEGEYRLQTVNGSGEVVLYYPMTFSVSTNVSANMTVVSITETGPAERLRNPANPLEAIDAAIARVDAKRGELGALDNRLEQIVGGNQLSGSNLIAARSRIEDADYAVEVSSMMRSQILQQAGDAVLAQANQLPQVALTLLRG